MSIVVVFKEFETANTIRTIIAIILYHAQANYYSERIELTAVGNLKVMVGKDW